MDDEEDMPVQLQLSDMVIGATDTLRGIEHDLAIPPTWNDTPPLLIGPRNTPETPVLLKGVR